VRKSRILSPICSHSSFGDRAFAAANSGLWNSLPSHVRDADLSYNRFQRSL